MAKKPNGNGAKAAETAPATEPAVAPIDVAKELQDNGVVVEMPSDGVEEPTSDPVPEPDGDAEPTQPPEPESGNDAVEVAPIAVTFTLGAGERTLNGRRRFPATVVARNPDGTVDLLVDYGQPQGTGTRRNVRQGAEAGCWS
jgi:hypothetical protein